MAERDLNEGDLDAAFAAARKHAPAPSEALMARVLADAEAAMVARRAPAPEVRQAPGHRRVAGILGAIGGWGGIGGLATAIGAGVWIGIAGLADPVTMVDGLFGSAPLSVELMPGADSFDIAGTGW